MACRRLDFGFTLLNIQLTNEGLLIENDNSKMEI